MAERTLSTQSIRQEGLFSNLHINAREGYAGLVADDWERGFLHIIFQSGGKSKAERFKDYLDQLRDGTTPEHLDLIARTAGSLATYKDVISLTVERQGMRLPAVVASARGRLYKPKNPFKKPYVYMPDAFGQDAESLQEAINGTAASLRAEDERVVVDTFPANRQSQEMLTSLGFVASKEQTWEAPQAMKPFVGQNVQVIQFTNQTN